MQTETAEQVALAPEVEWAIKQFTLQGFNPTEIEVLMDFKVDHHDTDALLNRGCTKELAYLILL